MSALNSVKQKLPPSVRSKAAYLWRNTFGRQYPRRSWSQGGEDLVLIELLGSSPSGTYVDVGAFHPRWGSNTHALYRRGWSGINIDARPGSMAPFRRSRRRDVNLEVGIGPAAATMDFYVFVDDELCTFDADLARQRSRSHRMVAVEQVEVLPLSAVIARHFPAGIDLLLVDAEGFDVEVLKSNDWDRFRPKLVVVEALGGPSRITASEAGSFLTEVGYELVAATGMNLFYSPCSTRAAGSGPPG